MKVTYSSNNSGGGWWLTDANWIALEESGWEVDWSRDNEFQRTDADGRWLGALATSATREGLTLREAIDEWTNATGEIASALGCNCCGPPHNFTFEGDHGESEYYSPDPPLYGDPYDG